MKKENDEKRKDNFAPPAADETELKELITSAISKQQGMSDDDFAGIAHELILDFE